MSAGFVIPDWMVAADGPSPPPPDTADVDPHRVEALVNRFIAAKQEAMFTAPDAYYRTTAGDAVDGAPAIRDRLNTLRDATLEAAGDVGTRFALGPRLDLHTADASDGIDRHAAAQREAFNRQVISERQTLIQRAAELEHDNDDKLAGLAEANASAALELARMTGQAEGSAMDSARSAVWHSAIGQRIANGDGPGALALFQRARHQLSDDHILSLDTPLQVARHDQTAEQWIANQTGIDGPPPRDRVAADPDLRPETKDIIRAKLDARDSAEEAKRVATVQGLDDQVRAAYRAQATNPGAYKPGTFARLADAYAAAGEPERAEEARRVAAWDSFMLAFAQASAEKQQRMIDDDDLPPEKRDHARGLRDLQAYLFTRDAFTAGTAVYKEVGPPVSIDDVEGRVRQARQIAQLRGGIPVLPFTADEIAGMRRAYATGSETEKQAVRTRMDAAPEDMRPVLETPAPSAPRDNTGGPIPTRAFGVRAASSMPAKEDTNTPDPAASTGGQGGFVPEPAPGTDVYRTAEKKVRDLQVKEQVTTDRAISQWVSKAQPGSQMPTELADPLDPAERQQIEGLVSGTESPKTDPKVLADITNGLKSRNPETQREWAQKPLYRYRSQLSASDFRKVVELQDDLDPDSGYSRSEIARIRKQLADRPDTSDLDWFYQALAPDPDVTYGENLPIGVDRNGKTRWFVLPELTRRFLKGLLDLLKGTKTGELTPEAIETFTGITGGAGRAFGPRGDGATFGAGGTRRPLSAAEQERRRKQLRENNANGRAWEQERTAAEMGSHQQVAPQITLVTKSGRRGRIDLLVRDLATGAITGKEFKASVMARLSPEQRAFLEDFLANSATVVGKGKQGFEGGLEIRPQAVHIDRKGGGIEHVRRPTRQD